MSRRGYTTPYEERERSPAHVDETTVVRRQWEDLIDQLTIQAVRTGTAENHKGNMRDDKERAILKHLRRQVAVGVRRIERTFWREAQKRTYASIRSWVRESADSGSIRVEAVEAEIDRRLAVLRKTDAGESIS
jgi:hypothetical protein